MIMFAGMVFNIFNCSFLLDSNISFLTGHHTLIYMACMIGVILSVAGFTSLPLTLLGGLAPWYYYECFPGICAKIYGSINWK